MAKQLTQEAKDFISGNTKMYVDLCEILEIKPSALPSYLTRNTGRLIEYPAVIAIATAMGKQPEDILIEEEENATA